jgi:hypothetical protein
MKAKTRIDIEGGALARFTAVQRRLKAAGYATMSGAGYGAYGTDMVLTSATASQAKAVLDGTTFAAALTYDKPLGNIEIK